MRDPRSRERDAWKGLAAGVIGGLVASWTMNQFQALVSALSTKDKPKGQSADPGDDATVKAASAVSEGIFDHTLTKWEKGVAGPAVHYALGTSMGGIYGVAAELAPSVRAGAGVPFGAVFWLLADEAAVPALGLSKAPTQYPLSTHTASLAAHVVYGVTTEVVRRGARRLLG
ncbi:MAG: DUF1440 domain-containing protein [Acidobacteria bacterium]|nr:DUF1440 domain-containing protein [Acidobacteriota bacterium]